MSTTSHRELATSNIDCQTIFPGQGNEENSHFWIRHATPTEHLVTAVHLLPEFRLIEVTKREKRLQCQIASCGAIKYWIFRIWGAPCPNQCSHFAIFLFVFLSIRLMFIVYYRAK